jgi:hypothetical protein
VELRLAPRIALKPLLLAAALIAVTGGCGSDGNDEPAQRTAPDTTQVAAAERHAALVAKARRLIRVASRSQEGKSRKEQIRIATAEFELGRIAGKDLSAVRPLLVALKRRDYELIAHLSGFYIALGKPGSEPILAETAARLYDPSNTDYVGLPFEFLSAGNPRLRRAVIEELESRGYSVSGTQGPTGLKWGSSGAYK